MGSSTYESVCVQGTGRLDGWHEATLEEHQGIRTPLVAPLVAPRCLYFPGSSVGAAEDPELTSQWEQTAPPHLMHLPGYGAF